MEYEKSKEYLAKQELIQTSRLKMARIWLMIVTFYYIFRCIFVIFPRYKMRDKFEQSMIIVQLVGMSLTLLGMIYSYFVEISVIKWLLYL